MNAEGTERAEAAVVRARMMDAAFASLVMIDDRVCCDRFI